MTLNLHDFHFALIVFVFNKGMFKLLKLEGE